MKTRLLSLFAMLLLLTQCASESGSNRNQMIGTLMGGAGGAFLGSKVGKGKGRLVGVAVGTLAGAAIGNRLGAALDPKDVKLQEQTTQQTLETVPSGQALAWNNPDSGHSGTITPVRTFQTGDQFCREFTQTINIGDKMEEGVGKACRQPDGTWRIVQ